MDNLQQLLGVVNPSLDSLLGMPPPPSLEDVLGIQNHPKPADQQTDIPNL